MNDRNRFYEAFEKARQFSQEICFPSVVLKWTPSQKLVYCTILELERIFRPDPFPFSTTNMAKVIGTKWQKISDLILLLRMERLIERVTEPVQGEKVATYRFLGCIDGTCERCQKKAAKPTQHQQRIEFSDN